MHPIYRLKETGLEERHRHWVGRAVVDRYGQHLGHVKEILVEERSIEEALANHTQGEGWTVRADFVVVTVETGLLGRVLAKHVVLLPIDSVREQDGQLIADENGDEIRVALGA